MTLPTRLRIQRAMSAVLESITPANGYEFDLEGKVFRGRHRFGDKDPIPMISILEAPIPIDQRNASDDGAQSTGKWELTIQGFVQDDFANPTDPAHMLMAAVKKRLAEERAKANWDRPEDGIFGLGRDVIGMYIGGGVVRPPDEISAMAYFWLTVTLDISEDLADPYAN